MQRSTQSNSVLQVAKAGFGGVCSIYLVFFGIFLCFVGAILVGTSYDSNFQSDFFADSNRGKRVAGFILLAGSIIVLTIGCSLCCYVCKTARKATNSTSQPGTVLTSGTLVSGAAPPGPITGYHTNQPSHPIGQLPYTPQGFGQPYAPPPQQPYVPPPQQPYAPLPQQQPYAPPPQQPYATPPQHAYPTAPPAAYPPAGGAYPSAGYPAEGSAPYAPPPSYNEVASELPMKGGYP